jgi:hypothetical protein
MILEYLSFAYNFFTGNLPNKVEKMTSINEFSIEMNHITGTVPAGMSQWSNLTAIYLLYNMLSGNLDNVFDSTSQHKLFNIDVSDNRFSGSLPPEIFNIDSLLSFAAISNCITGIIPTNICDMKSLASLALDGLHAATACQNRIFPHFPSFKAYTLETQLPGGIPECLFQMQSLETLHLSGTVCFVDVF